MGLIRNNRPCFQDRSSGFIVIFADNRENHPGNISKKKPVISEINTECPRYRPNVLSVRKLEKHILRHVLRKEQYPFLMAAQTEIPCFTCILEQSDERPKVIISALRVSTAYPGYTFGIIATVQKFKDCLLDSYDL